MVDLTELEEYALVHNVPIMQKAGIEYLVTLFKNNDFNSCLEIGTAIGYSALSLVTNLENFKVETIERNEIMYQEAQKNIKKYGQEKNIISHLADALDFDITTLELKKYDCIFIDAAKAQYKKFFLKYIDLMNDNGVCVVDNLDFHGMIYDIENINNRNTRALVRKIKRFKDWILTNPNYEASYINIGDGLVLIRKKVI